uniref:(northern house mosquito) hypothetical protein n=1 Tax=Culex pipiens TaxID=7175 RepID=A0A8D8NP77_CULPI
MPLDQTLSQESMPLAPMAPSEGYRLRSGSWMPWRPSLLCRGTALPRYSTRQRQIGVESPMFRSFIRTGQRFWTPSSYPAQNLCMSHRTCVSLSHYSITENVRRTDDDETESHHYTDFDQLSAAGFNQCAA